MIFGFLRRRRRDALRGEVFPAAWARVVERRAPWATRLDPAARARLEWLVQVFLAEVVVEGCGGMEVDEEVRVTLAVAAARLLLGLEVDAYEDLVVVRVYPSAFVAPVRRRDGLLVLEGAEARAGESWRRGLVVLAWDAVLRGLRDPDDGHDVVLHEFAHQLDTRDGVADGAPPLPDAETYRAWAGALGTAYDALRAELARGREGLLDAYGAQDPAEFFAVATEVFFERPGRLRREEPELYAALARFYHQDPAADPAAPGRRRPG